MKIYCINCIEREDRYKSAKEELKNNGYEDITWIRNKRMKNGTEGCFLSHLQCYKNLLNSNDQYCLIFEDDIKFIKQTKQNKIDIDRIPLIVKKWDVIFLGYRTIKTIPFKENNIFLEGNFLQAHSYIINRKVAMAVLKYYAQYKQYEHIDILLNSKIKNIRIIALKFRLTIQRQFKSDNTWINKFSLENITNNRYYEVLQLCDSSLLEQYYWRTIIYINKITNITKIANLLL